MMTFQKARETMAKEFKKDPQFRQNDRHGIKNHEKRNKAADEIIRAIISFWCLNRDR